MNPTVNCQVRPVPKLPELGGLPSPKCAKLTPVFQHAATDISKQGSPQRNQQVGEPVYELPLNQIEDEEVALYVLVSHKAQFASNKATPHLDWQC